MCGVMEAAGRCGLAPCVNMCQLLRLSDRNRCVAPRITTCLNAVSNDVRNKKRYRFNASTGLIFRNVSVCTNRSTCHQVYHLYSSLGTAFAFLCTFGTCPRRCILQASPAADWSARRTNQRERHAEAAQPATGGSAARHWSQLLLEVYLWNMESGGQMGELIHDQCLWKVLYIMYV